MGVRAGKKESGLQGTKSVGRESRQKGTFKLLQDLPPRRCPFGGVGRRGENVTHLGGIKKV